MCAGECRPLFRAVPKVITAWHAFAIGLRRRGIQEKATAKPLSDQRWSWLLTSFGSQESATTLFWACANAEKPIRVRDGPLSVKAEVWRSLQIE